ncbi:hypothetical protein EJ04DRAFT_507574 [Polyplosphaeria fusca]|uniref:SRR1-like domain-containing protein n=1 Tax=Polyplosphaeria fusca TaxID=682080 RepID=A0A9P4V5Y5_9PLEO|nr:hypothetical protein EJ04DRAFT_507574 [Polyplosphaeria fusca]
MSNDTHSINVANLWHTILKHKPLFTREAFDQVVSQYSSVMSPSNAGKGQAYTLTNCHGETSELPNPLLEWEQPGYKTGLLISYRSYQAIVDESPWKLSAGLIHRWLPVYIAMLGQPLHSHHEDADSKYVTWTQQWRDSASRKRLLDCIRANFDTMEPIKQIAGFGLGSLSRTSEVDAMRVYAQHLIACDIRDLVDELTGASVDTGPELFVQDPAYCDGCVEILSRLNIKVVNNPNGFLLVDKNTFVLSFNPDVPVRQIVTDLTFADDGPAAMLCNTIKDDGTVFDGLHDSNITCTPYTTDPSSPILWAYRMRCVEVVFEELKMDRFEDDVGAPRKDGGLYEDIAGGPAKAALYLKKKVKQEAC